MLYVVPEGAPLVAERHLPSLLIILQVQGVSNIFAYPYFETFKYNPISPLKIVVGFASLDL